MMRKLLYGFIFSLVCSASSLADWEYTTDVDEMRNETNHSAILKTVNSNDDLSIILSSPDEKTISSTVLKIEDAKINCYPGDTCKALVKFDNGEIESFDYVNVTIEQNVSVPLEYIEFARKIKNSDVVFIELPIEGKGMQQFKFKTSGLKWKVE